ncbi:zinc ribbon domain-containing protein [Haloarcula marina]|uniref:zinc ribbon domain-containing protein n=1 Tax=Haloarcula marina TaxID=2961574 RepID=UPI0020B7260C|nr:zinc ribbon domain-containing protein [Halomicroarcula marina]
MFTLGELYVLVVTITALVALIAAVPVLLGIVREGRERWRTGGPPPTDEPAGGSTDGGGTDDPADLPARRDCPHCGAANGPGFAYCQECVQRL